MEGKDGWHGKPLKKGEELDKALAELQSQFVPEDGPPPQPRMPRTVSRAGAQTGEHRAVGLQARRQRGHARGVRRRDRPPRRQRRSRRRARRRREELDVQREVRAGASRPLLPDIHRRTSHDWRRDGAGEPRRDSVPVDVRRIPDARLRFHPHGGHQLPERQDGGVACRRVDWRGRTVADGARRPGDDARAAEHRRALSIGRGQH